MINPEFIEQKYLSSKHYSTSYKASLNVVELKVTL
jgi:hypothetical protein